MVNGERPYLLHNANDNMKKRSNKFDSFIQTWDAENRLTGVTETGSGETTAFLYDPDGNRVKTVNPDGSVIYTPFPDYEEQSDQPPAVTLRANGQTSLQIWPNTPFTLSWSSVGAVSCQVNGAWGSGSRPAQGEENVFLRLDSGTTSFQRCQRYAAQTDLRPTPSICQ